MTGHTVRSAVVAVVTTIGIAGLANGLRAQDGENLLTVEIVSVIPDRMDY